MITLNSATLVNKALEVIEAHLLFDVPYDRIDVTVHPQSIVHSMVTFVDGATIAKASPPSMKLPIALAWAGRTGFRTRRRPVISRRRRNGRSSLSTMRCSRRSMSRAVQARPVAA